VDLQQGGVIISIRIQDIEVCVWAVVGLLVPMPGSSIGMRALRLPMRTRPSGLASSVNRSLRRCEMRWKQIPDFPDYTISEFGDIKNRNGKILVQRVDKYGYKRVNLQKEGGKHTVKTHFAVISAFTSIKRSKNISVDHIDGDKINNHISNLRWIALGENVMLQHYRNNDEVFYYLSEILKLYPDKELPDALKEALSEIKKIKGDSS